LAREEAENEALLERHPSISLLRSYLLRIIGQWLALLLRSF